jgi:flagellar basal body-associated protein FliL
MRALIGLVAVALVALTVWMFTRDPGGREANAVAPVKVLDAPARRAPEVPPPAPRAPATAAPMPVKEPPTLLAPEPVEEPVEAEQGPFEVSLGKHTIQVRSDDPSVRSMVDIELVAVTPTATTRNELGRRRRDVVRMLFFLASHRTSESVALAEADRVFADDLLERLRNVIRTGEITELKVVSWKIYERPALAPDEGHGVEP